MVGQLPDSLHIGRVKMRHQFLAALLSILIPLQLAAAEDSSKSSESSSEAETIDQETRYFGKDLGHTSTMNHYLVNVLVGGLTGAGFGLGFSLMGYDNSAADHMDSATPYIAVSFLLGAGLGLYASIDEQDRNQQFTTGKSMWQASWYGFMLGGITGGMIGLIPWSSSKDTRGEEDIYRFTGLGALIGVPVSLILWSIFAENPETVALIPQINMAWDPLQGQSLQMRYQHRF
jgi:hypothetical protein